MATTNRYAKRQVIVDELMKLGYNITPKKTSSRRKQYEIKKDNVAYRMDFNKDWVAVNQDQERLYCGINLSSGQRLKSCMDSRLTKLLVDLTTIAYKRTDIGIPTIIL